MLEVNILVKPGEDSLHSERLIRRAAANLKIPVKVNHTSNFRAFTHLAVNPSQTPIIVINGNVEFAGPVVDIELVQGKLAEIYFR